VTNIFNKIYNFGVLPDEWLSSMFITLPKKPKAGKCEEYRAISLMSHALKIFLRIIYKRIRNKCEDYVSKSQYGFRKKSGTIEAISGLGIIAERCIDVQKDLYVCFVDYEKAFDRIKQENLLNILTEVDLGSKELIIIIKNLYWNQKACVRLEQDKTAYIDIKRGVRRGYVISNTI
jgi:hypothetical protein